MHFLYHLYLALASLDYKEAVAGKENKCCHFWYVQNGRAQCETTLKVEWVYT